MLLFASFITTVLSVFVLVPAFVCDPVLVHVTVCPVTCFVVLVTLHVVSAVKAVLSYVFSSCKNYRFNSYVS